MFGNWYWSLQGILVNHMCLNIVAASRKHHVRPHYPQKFGSQDLVFPLFPFTDPETEHEVYFRTCKNTVIHFSPFNKHKQKTILTNYIYMSRTAQNIEQSYHGDMIIEPYVMKL